MKLIMETNCGPMFFISANLRLACGGHSLCVKVKMEVPDISMLVTVGD